MTRAKQPETRTEKKEDDPLMAAFAAMAAAIPSKKRKARALDEAVAAYEQKLDDLDIKKPRLKQHHKKSTAEGSTSKTPKSTSKATKALPDISDIQLYREETDEVPVYDDCNEIRRKIKAHMKTPGLTQAQFCRDLYAQLNAPKCKGIQSKQLTDFCRAKGANAGAKSSVFYAAYVYFEKLRIAQGKPLTKHRMDMEAVWPGGFPRDRDDRTTTYVVGAAIKLTINVPITNGSGSNSADGTCVFAYRQVNTKLSATQVDPCDHQSLVAKYASASVEDVNACIDAALAAKPAWEAMPFEERAAIFLRAANLITGKYRYDLMAATMVGQGENAWQAEIDSSVETPDFVRQYVKSAEELISIQPKINDKSVWNRMDYRPLEGFVYAVSPFNFTALGGTMLTPPCIMGNVVLWKPSDNSIAASFLLYQILLEAGLPKDVVQFVPGDPKLVTDTVLNRREFAGLNFIGSTAVFKELQGRIGKATAEGRLNQYPRVVGETGGKNCHLVTKSANVKSAAYNTLRAAFEYQGQKCFACSHVYISESIWPEFKKVIIEETKKLKVGGPEKADSFVQAVIHERAFDKLDKVIQDAKNDPEFELLVGGKASKEKGYFAYPTIYQTTNPSHDIMERELFGPIFGVYVYKDTDYEKTLSLIDSTSSYGLTGSIFANDPEDSLKAQNALKHAAGNLYLNTKCTGSVVGQQSFGGNRDSGTNDKRVNRPRQQVH
ncbi:hypothetical protein NM208_g3800 [Fusarium decemcellulare]|uniref:Uncharacterized protein n=1 Tax=Fusarium decemcellulare TaxID=57161 RepID=A0ACC1SMQ2_9HYPO|nr:hypothetical protein NM208_g3800 [Fusarium decemcellulare]